MQHNHACKHRRHVPVLLGLNEPWKSDENKALNDESRHLPPMPGSGLSLYKYGIKCADCGAMVSEVNSQK